MHDRILQAITKERQPDCLAYQLRLWRMRGAGTVGRRASLANPDTGERHGFASLDDLFLFLRQETGVVPDGEDAEDRTR